MPMSIPATLPSAREHRLDWVGVRTFMRDHYLRRSEIPMEHLVSLPMPTLRYGEPAFALHACATVREASGTQSCRPPDRHWAIAAHTKTLLFYARTSILPLAAPGETWASVTLEQPAASVKAMAERLRAL